LWPSATWAREPLNPGPTKKSTVVISELVSSVVGGWDPKAETEVSLPINRVPDLSHLLRFVCRFLEISSHGQESMWSEEARHKVGIRT
jgi:hypothetical protein